METYKWTGDQTPEFDQELADTYIGKYILIGVTYVDKSGNLLEQVQMHGVVKRATPEGVEIELKGKQAGEIWNMPPSLESIGPANPGVYTLRSSGESIENPDLLAQWTVTKPWKQ